MLGLHAEIGFFRQQGASSALLQYSSVLAELEPAEGETVELLC